MRHVDYIIMTDVGLFFTLLGYEIISLGMKPDAQDPQRLEKWYKALKLYRWGGPVIFVCGLLLWLFSP